jgi:tetratricopeptide (TPR) repeat protein
MLVFVLASCVAQAAPPPPDAAAALARGDAAHAAFDDTTARGEYERALALEPTSVETRARLAHALNDLGEAAAAERREAEARTLLERALALAEGLQRDAPDRPEGHYALAATLGNLTPLLSGPGKVGAARRIDEAARRATELDPCLAPAYGVLGITYRELASLGGFVRGFAQAALGGLPKGTLADSAWLLQAAVALDPDDPFHRYQLALTLERLGRPGEAAAALEASLALTDREARDRRNRADAGARLARLRRVDSPRR